MGKTIQVTPDVLNEAVSVGVLKCPDCKEPMRYLEAKETGKDEWYCEKCHLSVPAFRK